MDSLQYYKERACCDPTNKWGHTRECKQVVLNNRIIELTETLKTVWNYFHPINDSQRIDKIDMLDEVYYALTTNTLTNKTKED